MILEWRRSDVKRIQRELKTVVIEQTEIHDVVAANGAVVDHNI